MEISKHYFVIGIDVGGTNTGYQTLFMFDLNKTL